MILTKLVAGLGVEPSSPAYDTGGLTTLPCPRLNYLAFFFGLRRHLPLVGLLRRLPPDGGPCPLLSPRAITH